MMHYRSWSVIIIWLQVTSAAYQIQLAPELEYVSSNLGPDECVLFYKLLQGKKQRVIENHIRRADSSRSSRFRRKFDCERLLISWLENPQNLSEKAHHRVELALKEIGRNDLAYWLGRNQFIHQSQLTREENYMRGSTAVLRKDDENSIRIEPARPALDETGSDGIPPQTVFQKLMITIVMVISMTTLCLCCYKFLYARMRGGHFTNFRQEFDEESWLRQDRQCGGGSRSCFAALADPDRSFWNSFRCGLGLRQISPIEYLKKKFETHNDHSRDQRRREFRQLMARLQKTCPTQRKIIHLSRKEQHLLKSLTDAEKDLLPTTDSDFKFLVASDREKRKLLAYEGRREFLIDLRKRLEKIGPDNHRNITLNEAQRKLIRKLSPSERLLLPVTDRDLELMVSDPLEKRQVIMKQMTSRFEEISHEDRKYLELDCGEKKFLKEIDDKEKKKLGITDSEYKFLVASKSQRNLLQQRLEPRERNRRIKEIEKKLTQVNCDISRLDLSKTERSFFLSLTPFELAQLGLTEDHVRFYTASDCERQVMWPSPSQHRNMRIITLQTKLSKLPWKECSPRLSSSEYKLLASLTPREQDKLHISISEKNFILSTDCDKELIQRQKNIEKLQGKIRDFNTVMMTESERCLILSLSPSEMQMLNMDSTNKSSLTAEKSDRLRHREAATDELDLVLSKDKVDADCQTDLTKPEQTLPSCLTSSEITTMTICASRADLLPYDDSVNDQHQRMTRLEMIRDKIHSKGISNVRLTNSERELMESLTNSEIDSVHLTPSQVSFLIAKESDCHAQQAEIQCRESLDEHCESLKDVQVNTSPQVCNQETSNSASCRSDSGSEANSDQKHVVESQKPIEQHDTQGNSNACEGDAPAPLHRESTDDSELSESYDELGMLFSQQMKQQARPCQRKYCLLGRHLKRGIQHDEQQCQVRHHCCRGYPSDQRPSCSSDNVCKDTYDELELMQAASYEKKQLNSSMFERRKQFLGQPCQKCTKIHDHHANTD